MNWKGSGKGQLLKRINQKKTLKKHNLTKGQFRTGKSEQVQLWEGEIWKKTNLQRNI